MAGEDPMPAGRAFVQRARERGKSGEETARALRASEWAWDVLVRLWSQVDAGSAGTALAPAAAEKAPPVRAGPKRTASLTARFGESGGLGEMVRMGDDCLAALDTGNVGPVVLKEELVKQFRRDNGSRTIGGPATCLAAATRPLLCHGERLSVERAAALCERAQVARTRLAHEAPGGLPVPGEWDVPLYVVRFRQ